MPNAERSRILLVADAVADAELVLRELQRGGVACTTQRVQSEAALRAALHSFAPDVVLADHALPGFNASDALRVVREQSPDTPVVIVTGSLDEETAAEYIKAGAADLVLKQRLQRLCPAVRRALELRRALAEAARAEAARRRSTEFLRHTQSVAHVGSWEWDMTGDVVTWSDETYRIFGVSPAAGPITYERYLALIHPEDRDAVKMAVTRTLQTLEPYEIDHRIIRSDGSIRFLFGRGGVVSDGAGRPARLTGAVLDITARHQAEDALRQAVAHDFNSLLTAILGAGEFLLEILPADHAGREDAAEIRKAALRGADLTRQLLAFSHQQILAPRVFLPRGAATPGPAAAAGSPRGAETILLVEDQEDVRALMLRILKKPGYRVLVAASGAEALVVAEQQGGAIDLLVTDVVMPGMSGSELGAELGPRFPAMKVLYLSGYTNEAILQQGVLGPGVAFLQKPFTPEGLARKVREVLG